MTSLFKSLFELMNEFEEHQGRLRILWPTNSVPTDQCGSRSKLNSPQVLSFRYAAERSEESGEVKRE